jgi:hypothetical protein
MLCDSYIKRDGGSPKSYPQVPIIQYVLLNITIFIKKYLFQNIYTNTDTKIEEKIDKFKIILIQHTSPPFLVLNRQCDRISIMIKKPFLWLISITAAIILIMLPFLPGITLPNKNQSANVMNSALNLNSLKKISDIPTTSSSNNYSLSNQTIGTGLPSRDTFDTGSQATSSLKEKEIVTITVRGISYPVEITTTNTTTVYDAMTIAAKNKKLSFKAIKNSTLGYFINEINDIKSTSNEYWIFYVNGNEANVGISSYVLKPGDNVVWKLETSDKKEVL